MPTKKPSGKQKEKCEEIDNFKNNKELEEKIDHLEKELEEKNEKLLRSYSDLQNYHKIMQKELTYNENHINKKYIIELIYVY